MTPIKNTRPWRDQNQTMTRPWPFWDKRQKYWFWFEGAGPELVKKAGGFPPPLQSHQVDKPARFIIRLLFPSLDYLDFFLYLSNLTKRSTNSETLFNAIYHVTRSTTTSCYTMRANLSSTWADQSTSYTSTKLGWSEVLAIQVPREPQSVMKWNISYSWTWFFS